MDKRILHGVQLGCIGIATLFSVLAIALDKWEHQNRTTGTKTRLGLWHGCSSDECVVLDIDGRVDYYMVRALMFGGLLFCIGTVVCSIGSLLIESLGQLINICTAIASGVAGTLLMSGFSVYAEDIKLDGTEYGACFALTVVAWLLAWGSGITCLYRMYLESQPIVNQQHGTVVHTNGTEHVSVTMSQNTNMQGVEQPMQGQ